MSIVFIVIGTLSILATLIPLIANKKWWIRAFDFPHLQVTFLTFVSLVGGVFFLNTHNKFEIAFLCIVVLTLIYQLKIIFPYTPFATKQIADTKYHNKSASIRIFSSNVLQDNHDFERFKKVFISCNPDIAVLLETDSWWCDKLDTFKEYLYSVVYPLDNYYGIVLLSKLPLKDSEVKFLITEDIPSIHAKVQLKNGTWIRLYCLHPMPPSPTENEKSLDRDAELLLVAKEVKQENGPVIVLGDLNDVAWSHTTRMFQRISRLLDPRIGRGFYNTFHVSYPFLRWPLDHLFVSNDFQLTQLKRLPSVGSDHFPMFAELCHNCDTKANETPDKASAEDKQEAKETITKGKEENNN